MGRHFRIAQGQGSTNSSTDYHYMDIKVATGQTYYYRLCDIDYQGFRKTHPVIAVLVVHTEQNNLPGSFTLRDVYPNPFNPTTTLSYDLSEAGLVDLTIYNQSGQPILTLLKGEESAGYKSIIRDGHDNTGRLVCTGVYFCRLTVNGYGQTKKMVLNKYRLTM